VKLAYSVRSAAEAIEVSEDTIRRAIKATDPNAWPPPLAAKTDGRRIRIEAAELQRWFHSWKDA
jgi:transposase